MDADSLHGIFPYLVSPIDIYTNPGLLGGDVTPETDMAIPERR